MYKSTRNFGFGHIGHKEFLDGKLSFVLSNIPPLFSIDSDTKGNQRKDRENFYPMQNIYFRFVWFNYKIRYGDNDNNECHERDLVQRSDPKCWNNC